MTDRNHGRRHVQDGNLLAFSCNDAGSGRAPTAHTSTHSRSLELRLGHELKAERHLREGALLLQRLVLRGPEGGDCAEAVHQHRAVQQLPRLLPA